MHGDPASQKVSVASHQIADVLLGARRSHYFRTHLGGRTDVLTYPHQHKVQHANDRLSVCHLQLGVTVGA